MLNAKESYGFVVFDGSGLLIANVSGATIQILSRVDAHLPKKHGKGGQSAPRFQHIRLEMRMHFRRKCEEQILKCFISPVTTLANVTGIIIAGSSNFKNELELDGRLRGLVLATLTVQYSGTSGLHQAISQSGAILSNVRLVAETKILGEFFTRIDRDQPVSFGLVDTRNAMEQGAVDVLLLSESMAAKEFFRESEFKGRVEILSEATREGSQFGAGFGGVGALLKFAIYTAEDYGAEIESDSDDESFV